MFPVEGGTANPVNKIIFKHNSVPIVTDQRICIKSCVKPTTTTSTEKPPPTPPPHESVTYNVGFKLIDNDESLEAPQPGTPEFEKLESEITDSFTRVLRNTDGFTEIENIEFEK